MTSEIKVGDLVAGPPDREMYAWVLSNQFNVDVLDADSDETVARALEAAYHASPSDSAIGETGRGLGQARLIAGANNARLVLILARHQRSSECEAA